MHEVGPTRQVPRAETPQHGQVQRVPQPGPAAPAASVTMDAAGRPVPTVVAAAVASQAVPRPLAQRMPAAPPQPPAPAPTTPLQTPAVAPPAAPPRPRPVSRTASFPVLRVVCWQLALVMAFLAIGRPWPVTTTLLLGATGLIAVTAICVRGRWLSEELGLRLRLRMRRRNCDLPERDTAGALLRLLAPGARVQTADLAGSAAGVVSRAEELVAVLRPLDCTPDGIARMALTEGLLPDDDPALPTVRLRLLLHRSPRRPGTPVEHPKVWLAIGAVRDSDFPGDDELTVSLSNTVRRVRRKLRGAGMDAVPLSDGELATVLTSLAHTGPGGRAAVREQWRYWRAGPISQAGLRIAGLEPHPNAARSQFVHRLLAMAGPDVAMTAALSCTAEPDAVLRVASTTDAAVDTTVGSLSRLAAMLGVRLIRMDGQHAPAVAASLPIGGNRG